MPPTAVDPAHQAFILTRLAEFTQYKGAVVRHEANPWDYMRQKLISIEPELAALKNELLAATTRKILADLKKGPLGSDEAADFRVLLERLLSRGEFVDAAMHLEEGAQGPAAAALDSVLSRAKATNGFIEERRALDSRDPSWDKLVDDITKRLELDGLDKIMQRKKRTPLRKRMVLRRLRRNVAEYCTVVRIPTSAEDTFTPFMLPRIEALIAANLRFLNKWR